MELNANCNQVNEAKNVGHSDLVLKQMCNTHQDVSMYMKIVGLVLPESNGDKCKV